MPRKKRISPKNGANGSRRPNGTPRTHPVSRETGFQKLRAMKCFPEVHERICDGWPISEVATFVQEKRGEYTDAKHITLMTVLQRYRDSLPKSELVKKRIPKYFVEAMHDVEAEIDELIEFTRLYRLQMERIGIDHQTERNIRKLFPTMTQEIRVAGEILNRIAQLKMDLGMNERHLGKVDVETQILGEVAARYEGTEIGKILEDPKSRGRLRTIAEHALSLSKRGIEIDAGALVSEDDSKEEAC